MNYGINSGEFMVSAMNMAVKALIMLVISVFCLFCVPAEAATPGTTIDNTAIVTFDAGPQHVQVASNTVVTSLNLLVDVQNRAVTSQSATLPDGTPGYSYSFTVGNGGNAPDRFSLAAAFISLSSSVDSLWIDSNGNGVVDTASDRRIDPADPVIALTPGQGADIIVLAAAAGTLGLTATSLNTDPDAIVWHRSVTARLPTPQTRRVTDATLIKAQSIDTLGAAQPGAGSIITYTLTAFMPGRLAASAARITDTIPIGTTYVPGSLSLDGAALTEAVGDDAGAFATTTRIVSVVLPDAGTEDSSHTVRFQVRIN